MQMYENDLQSMQIITIRQWAVFGGALRYEFRMQVRRPAVWITLFLIACLLFSIQSQMPRFVDVVSHLDQFPLLQVTATWANLMARLFPIGIGVLLADRLPRDRRTKVDELFTTLPGSLLSRLLGKYIGSMVATLIPVLIVYMLGVCFILYQTHNMLVLPLALETFAVIVLPGIFFVSAFSLAIPVIMWVPLYQFGFIGYWFWGNGLDPIHQVPTLTGTILMPNGHFMAMGFYNLNIGAPGPTPLKGLESILLLLGLAIVALLVLWRFLCWQQANT